MARDAEQAYLDRLQTRLDQLVQAGSLTADVRSGLMQTMRQNAEGDDGEIARLQREHGGRIQFRDTLGRFAPEATAAASAPVAVALSDELSEEDEAAELDRLRKRFAS